MLTAPLVSSCAFAGAVAGAGGTGGAAVRASAGAVAASAASAGAVGVANGASGGACAGAAATYIWCSFESLLRGVQQEHAARLLVMLEAHPNKT